MDNKKFKPILLIMIFLALFITGCGDPRDQEPSRPMGHGSYGDIRGYDFDPKTILTALDRNDGEIFQPLPDWGLQEAVFPSDSFAWQQQDYLNVANALNRVASQDNLEGWNVYRIFASRDCADTPVGFDLFSITYFKSVEGRYATRQMDLRLLSKEADWAGTGLGLCNISDAQMETDFGDRYKAKNGKKGYGLGLYGKDQTKPRIAALALKRKIKLVIDASVCIDCSSTDKFIVAALGQASMLTPETLGEWTPTKKRVYSTVPNGTTFYWEGFFKDAENHGQYKILRELKVFSNDVEELGKRGWFVPGMVVFSEIKALFGGW
jgi:hypothetical protein